MTDQQAIRDVAVAAGKLAATDSASKCRGCGGSGRRTVEGKKHSRVYACPDCRGSGIVPVPNYGPIC